ncbi:hypothetical protein AVEN_123739-1 [Araneus ventricosus]|uniref:Uncharacterized protein n=1 Tax=Araneus ventricosus TaxID=182803 RepID=A0A4Y2BMB0_ARAVE|nr:hypothetical protein AVEN_123739-1 [Araneus ventricosus]
MGSAFPVKRNIHEDTVPFHLERLVPKSVDNANIILELDCWFRKVWKCSVYLFHLAHSAIKLKCVPREGERASFIKTKKPPVGNERGGSVWGNQIGGTHFESWGRIRRSSYRDRSALKGSDPRSDNPRATRVVRDLWLV